MDTNSMDPVLDEDSNAIQIRPTSPSQIQVGDIISYSSPYGIIIHRIVEVGSDDSGWYARVRGDNNAYSDPEKGRFEQVKSVLVAVIYCNELIRYVFHHANAFIQLRFILPYGKRHP